MSLDLSALEKGLRPLAPATALSSLRRVRSSAAVPMWHRDLLNLPLQLQQQHPELGSREGEGVAQKVSGYAAGSALL